MDRTEELLGVGQGCILVRVCGAEGGERGAGEVVLVMKVSELQARGTYGMLAKRDLVGEGVSLRFVLLRRGRVDISRDESYGFW